MYSNFEQKQSRVKSVFIFFYRTQLSFLTPPPHHHHHHIYIYIYITIINKCLICICKVTNYEIRLDIELWIPNREEDNAIEWIIFQQ